FFMFVNIFLLFSTYLDLFLLKSHISHHLILLELLYLLIIFLIIYLQLFHLEKYFHNIYFPLGFYYCISSFWCFQFHILFLYYFLLYNILILIFVYYFLITPDHYKKLSKKSFS